MSKMNSRRLEILESQAKQIEKEVAKIAVFADGVRSDFWKRIEDKFKAQVEGLDKQLDGYSKLTNEQIRDLLANRLCFRGFLGMKDYVKAKTAFENKLTMVRQRIQEEKERERAS